MHIESKHKADRVEKNKKEKPKALKLDDKYYPQAEEKSDEEIHQEMLKLQRKLKEGSL